MDMNRYELYQGEEFLGKGTARELADKLDTSVKNIYQFASKQVHDRYEPKSNQKIAFKVNKRIKTRQSKSNLQLEVDKIEDLYFRGYDIKTILKVKGGLYA